MVDAWAGISLYLLRSAVTKPADALRSPQDLRQLRARPTAALPGDLFILPDPPDEQPAWALPLTGLIDGLPPLRTVTPGAVFVFGAAGRLFALTFGRGHSRLLDAAYVRDFGVRVAAALMDPEAVIGVDTRAVEQSVLLTRRHSSIGTGLGSIGVEPDREFVNALTGRPRLDEDGRRVTGRAALHLTRSVEPKDLASLAASLLDLYERRAYSASFPELDLREAVQDPRVLGELDGLLEAGLPLPERGGAYLAPPEIVDWDNVAGFRITGDPRGERRSTFSIEDYANAVSNDMRLDRMFEDHVTLIHRDGKSRINWPVHRCLIAQRDTADGTFVLSDGRWWLIHPTFIAQVRAELDRLDVCSVAMPPMLQTDVDEDAYNRRAAGLIGAVSLDSDLASFRGERGRVELCDIAGPDRRLIHVKKGVRSSTLSHLFAQSIGSAEVLRHMPQARAQLRQKLASLGSSLAAQVQDDSMNAREWEVVIAIAADPARVPHDLPFFSRAHLARTARTLKRLDYRVTIAAIEPA